MYAKRFNVVEQYFIAGESMRSNDQFGVSDKNNNYNSKSNEQRKTMNYWQITNLWKNWKITANRFKFRIIFISHVCYFWNFV